MKKTFGNIFKFILVILGLVVVYYSIGLFLYFDSYSGNPISKFFEGVAIQEYFDANYDKDKLKLSKTEHYGFGRYYRIVYNKKDNSYVTDLISETGAVEAIFKNERAVDTFLLNSFNNNQNLSSTYSIKKGPYYDIDLQVSELFIENDEGWLIIYSNGKKVFMSDGYLERSIIKECLNNDYDTMLNDYFNKNYKANSVYKLKYGIVQYDISISAPFLELADENNKSYYIYLYKDNFYFTEVHLNNEIISEFSS